MNSTAVRKMATLGVGLSMIAVVLVTARPSSAELCYEVIDGVRVGYECYHPGDPNLPEPKPLPVPVLNIPTKLWMLTQARTVSGPTTVSVSARLKDAYGYTRKSIPVNLCWKPVTASKESCVSVKTNSSGIAAVNVNMTTATTVRAVASATKATGASRSPSVIVRVAPKVAPVARVRSLTASVNPASRVKVMLQKKVGSRYVDVRAAYTSTSGAISFTKLTKGTYYRLYVYASAGRSATYSGAVRVR